MDKSDFIKALKEYKKEIKYIENICLKTSGPRIQAKTTLDGIEAFATKWFENFEPILRFTFNVDDEILNRYREPFGKLLELSGGKPSKKVILTILAAFIKSYHVDILVPVQKHELLYSKFPNLDTILTKAIGLEVDYLSEAIECANLGKKRAAIILGWCAAVNRLHLFIEKEGFTKFNDATVQMFNIQTGRYKRFKKRFEVQNLGDLRMSVFDNDLLWVLEFLGVIDGNQHEKLEICFTMRNTCAHPGEAIITVENLLSFFSDINTLIFTNPKFSIPSNDETD